MNVFELYASLQISIKAFKDGLNQASKEVEEFENKTTSKFDSLESAASKTFATIGEVAAAGIAAATAATNNLGKSTDKTEGEIHEAENALEDYSEEADEAADATQKLGDEEEKTTKKTSTFGDTLKAILTSDAIKAGLGALWNGVKATGKAFISIGKQAVDAYGNYEQLVGGINKLYGESGKELQEYANQAYSTAGMSANAYMQNVTGFSAALINSLSGDTSKAVKLANEAMRDISDNANTFGKYTVEELAQVYQALAKGNYQTLDNLMLGFAGTKEGMQDLLAKATEIAEKNGLLTEADYKYVESEKAQEKATKALESAQKSLASKQETYTKAQITYNNAVQKYGANSAQAQKAAISLESANKKLQEATEKAATAQQNLADAEKGVKTAFDINSYSDIVRAIHIVQTEMHISGLSAEEAAEKIRKGEMTQEEAFEAMGTTAKEASNTIQGSLGSVKAAWENLITGLADPDADIQKLCQNVIDSFNNLLNNITPIIENVIKTLPSAVKTLADNFVKLLPTLLETATSLFGEVLSSLITLLPELAKYAFDAVMTIVNTILENLPAIGEMAIQIILTLVNGISEALPTLIPTAVKVILSLIEVILDNLPLILDCALSLIEALANGIIAAIPILLQKLPILITKLLDFLVGSIPIITQAGIEIFTSLIKELPTIIELLCEALPKIIVALIAAIKENEVLITQAGQDLLMALIDNLPTIISSLIIGVITLITSLVDAICDDKNLEIFAKSGVELFLALIGNLPIILIELAKAVPEIIEAVAEAFFDNEYKFTEAGNNIVSGIWKGINELAPWLLSKVSEWVGGIWNGVCDWLGIASPSKKMAWVGQMMVKGLSNSIDDNGDEAVRAAETMTKNIADTVNGISDTDFNVNLNRNIIPQNDSGNNYTTQNSGHYSIVVNIANMSANSESDIEDLADRLMRIMEEKTVRRGSVFA